MEFFREILKNGVFDNFSIIVSRFSWESFSRISRDFSAFVYWDYFYLTSSNTVTEDQNAVSPLEAVVVDWNAVDLIKNVVEDQNAAAPVKYVVVAQNAVAPVKNVVVDQNAVDPIKMLLKIKMMLLP